ncbi:MAG: hypothetical protein DMG14_30830 [Acidobacteria bacterium]|nr:MAG: hypothetical protein DMG14_30830 [Acidobacteriota bacterium]
MIQVNVRREHRSTSTSRIYGTESCARCRTFEPRSQLLNMVSASIRSRHSFVSFSGSGPGLKAGDVITAVDGKRVSTPQEFMRQIRSAGSTVTLTIIRDKQEREMRLEGVSDQRTGPRRRRIGTSRVNVL